MGAEPSSAELVNIWVQRCSDTEYLNQAAVYVLYVTHSFSDGHYRLNLQPQIILDRRLFRKICSKA